MAYVYIVTQHFRKQSNGQEELIEQGDGEKKERERVPTLWIYRPQKP